MKKMSKNVEKEAAEDVILSADELDKDLDTIEYVNEVKFKSQKAAEVKSAKKLPPYAIRFNELNALFGDDDELTLSLDDETRTATIESKNFHKLDALAQVLRLENDGLKIEFLYDGESNSYFRTIEEVFKGNPHFDNIRIATEADTGIKHIITTFKDETIQYDADNRFVPHGYETTLAEKLVKNLFRKEFRRSMYVTKEKSKSYSVINYNSLNGTSIAWPTTLARHSVQIENK